MKTHVSKIWGKISKVQKISLLFVLTFLFLSRLLTWYAVSYLGAEEASAPVASLIQRYGAPLGLFINCVILLVPIFATWLLWVQFSFPLKRQRKWQLAVNLIWTFFVTSLFMVFFWAMFFDFAHDAAMVFFRSKVFFPLLKNTTFAIFALISSAIYLIFCCNFKKLAHRKRKRGA